jgi:glycosyltransferase involved in cell wall biosynthesis
MSVAPKASIVVPVRNGARTIGATLQSLTMQNSDRFEVLVVDDGSTDETGSIVRDLRDERVRLIECEGRGQSDGLNTGIRHATGSVFMRCDADDLYEPCRVAWQLEFLEKNPRVDAVCGGVAAVRNNGEALAPLHMGMQGGHDVAADLKAGKMRSHLGAYAIRMGAVRKAGGFRSFFVYSQDYDFLFRLGESASIVFMDRPAYIIRFSDSSVCRTTPIDVRRWYLQKAEEFRRERAETGADALDRGEAPSLPSIERGRRQRMELAVRDILCSAAWASLKSGCTDRALAYAVRAIRETPMSWLAWRCAGVVAAKAVLSRARDARATRSQTESSDAMRAR